MPTFNVFVDYSTGNDTTGTGATGAPYRTLVKAASTPPAGLVSGDDVNIWVRNGASGDLTTQRPVFNNAAWNGTIVRIRPDTGHVAWRATTVAGASEWIIRTFIGTCQITFELEDFVWVLQDNQQAVQNLNTVANLVADYTLRRGTITWNAWNIANALVSASAGTCFGNVTYESLTTTGMARVVWFNGLAGTLSMRNNTFGLGAGAGTWRVVDWGNNNNTRHAPSIYSSRNTWTGAGADGFTFLGTNLPLIQRTNKSWVFEGDTFTLDSVPSQAKFFNVDDVDAASTHSLSISFINTNISMDTNGVVFNIGRNVGSYTNAQMPRRTTLANDCTRRLARLFIQGCNWSNKNPGSAAALIAVRIGILSTRIENSTLSALFSPAHTCNFLSNDVTVINSTLLGLLPCLAFGDRITVDRCYVKGERPFVAGKTGGGVDEASQGHTVVNSTIVCTSTNPGYAAFDTYGWQTQDPYGPSWYDSTDTPNAGSTGFGLKGWTVRNNVFIATSGGSPVYLGRPSAAADHAGGQFTSVSSMLAFLADGNGGDGPWIDGASVFSGNSLVVGDEPILSDPGLARQNTLLTVLGMVS